MVKLTLKTKIAAKAAEKPVAALKNSDVVSSVVVRRKPKIEVFAPLRAAPDPLPKPQPSKPIQKTPQKVEKRPPPAPPKKAKTAEPIDPRPRAVRVQETLELLIQTYPHLFNETDPQPWVVGLRKTLWKALHKQKSRNLIGGALEQWKNAHPGYSEKLKIAGTPRIGIDGQPKGVVTAEQAAMALGSAKTEEQEENNVEPNP